MNERQKNVARIAAVVAGLMLLFPPFKYGGYSGGYAPSAGYSFFTATADFAGRAIQFDAWRLVIQLLGLCLVAFIIYKSFAATSPASVAEKTEDK